MRRFADENASEQVPDLGQRWARRIIPCSNLDALDALPPFPPARHLPFLFPAYGFAFFLSISRIGTPGRSKLSRSALTNSGGSCPAQRLERAGYSRVQNAAVMPIFLHDGTADKAGIFDALSAMERKQKQCGPRPSSCYVVRSWNHDR